LRGRHAEWGQDDQGVLWPFCGPHEQKGKADNEPVEEEPLPDEEAREANNGQHKDEGIHVDEEG